MPDLATVTPAVELAERQLATAETERDRLREEYESVQARVEALGEDADAADVTAISADLETAGQAYEDAFHEATRCAENLAAATRRAELDSDPHTRRPAAARGGRVEYTYRPDMPGRSFFRDAYLAEFKYDSSARDRLLSHTREMHELYAERGVVMNEPERRDVGTGAFTGLVVPQYLVDQFVELRRAGAPLLRYYRDLPLPEEGLQVNIGRLTTGTGVAAQATENTAVQETDADDTLLSVNVRTYAGMQDLSRQSIERGRMVDLVIYEDLVRAYFTTLDSATINADGTSGTHLGIRSTAGIVSVTYTDASPTVAEFYPKLQDAIQQINAGIFAPASLIVMHPRRWGWMNAAVDSQGRPLVVPNTGIAVNPIGVGDAAGYGTPVGSISGLPVVTDGNIPTNLGAGTNEDVVLVLGTTELFLWSEGDGMPRRFEFEATATAPATIRLAAWGYSAFTAGRLPTASAVIGGTGLVTPTF